MAFFSKFAKIRLLEDNVRFFSLQKGARLFYSPSQIIKKQIPFFLTFKNQNRYTMCCAQLLKYLFQILWKSRCDILVSFPSHLKKSRKWLNWTEKFSSVQKFTFLVNFELNSVHFFAERTWTELSSLIEWTWTKMNRKVQFIFLS